MALLTIQTGLELAQASGLERLDAQLLMLYAMQKPLTDRAWLLTHDAQALDAGPGDGAELVFRCSLKRRLAGEPLAYITGSKEFFGLQFAVDSRVLIPRPDTECLVDWALACLPMSAPLSVLDLGAGSGAIGLAIKQHRSACDVTLLDASQAALDVARKNATALGQSIRAVQSDWFEVFRSNPARFDLIVTNPPYIAVGDSHLTALQFEPQLALTSGVDGLDAIRRIVHEAPSYLAANGWLLIEHGFDQAVVVEALMTERGFAGVHSRLDLNGISRCTGGYFLGV
jgi:release factor glutamine methyltransferase